MATQNFSHNEGKDNTTFENDLNNRMQEELVDRD